MPEAARRRITGRDPGGSGGLAVTVEAGRIDRIEPTAVGADEPFLSAGLIDLQVNGFHGHDLNDGHLRPETVAALARDLRANGVTTFVPTLITASDPALSAALRAIASACKADPRLRDTIPFVHLEGPWLAAADGPRGAHPAALVRAPDLAQFAQWQSDADGMIGLVTLSPHFDNTPAIVRALVGQGVLVSLGHTDATGPAITAAVEAGARLSTHLGNGAAAMLPRHPNVIWTQLGDDRLTATFIADGHHLPAETLRAMIRAKGLTRAVLVSDVVALGGQPPGRYETPIGGLVDLSADGRLSVADTPYLAGAVKSLKDGVAGAVRMAGLSLAEALTLATENPGRFTGGRGALTVGARADLMRFRWQDGDATLTMTDVWLAGRPVT